uniref:Uncharacterized protein n=1 Tax=Setaria italica TaxID=4555 RepID=K3YC34_SETIT
MAGSDSSVQQAELHQLQNSLLEAMERMFMNVLLLQVEGIDNINMKNLLMKIQDMVFMTALELVVMNLFANHGWFEHHRNRRCGACHDGKHHRGRNRDDPNSIARVKLSVPKFTGKQGADAYLDWEKQCDQIFRVPNLSN